MVFSKISYCSLFWFPSYVNKINQSINQFENLKEAWYNWQRFLDMDETWWEIIIIFIYYLLICICLCLWTMHYICGILPRCHISHFHLFSIFSLNDLLLMCIWTVFYERCHCFLKYIAFLLHLTVWEIVVLEQLQKLFGQRGIHYLQHFFSYWFRVADSYVSDLSLFSILNSLLATEAYYKFSLAGTWLSYVLTHFYISERSRREKQTTN